MRWGGGDGEADPREGKKKLDKNVVLVSFFLGVEIIGRSSSSQEIILLLRSEGGW
jgi:hypothetical protein